MTPLSISRGLRGAGLCALVGAAAPVVLALAFMACGWIAGGADEQDRMDDLRLLQNTMILPVIGSAVVFACAGWSVYAPAGRHRFAWSLLIITIVSVPLWFIGGSMTSRSRGYKGEPSPIFDPVGLMILIGPPILTAALLTAWRVDRAKSTKPGSVGIPE